MALVISHLLPKNIDLHRICLAAMPLLLVLLHLLPNDIDTRGIYRTAMHLLVIRVTQLL